MSESPPRPSHTTLAAGIVIGGSVGVVIGIADQLSGLHSLETREAVTSFLAEPPGSSLGLDLTGALRALRVALMAVAGCATAAAVLGYHVLKRSHRARVGLTVLAAPIFLGGLATGGFLTSLVAASSVLLWIGPSAAWFRGESPPSGMDRSRAGRPAPSAFDAPAPPRSEQPPPAAEPFGRPPVRTEQQPPTGPVRPPGGRPDGLVWACVLTWAFCSLTLVVLLTSVVLVSINPDLVLDELRRQGRELPDGVGLLTATTLVLAGVAGIWSLAAIVLAALAYRRVAWARSALQVSAAGAAVLCLVASLSSLLALVPGVVCVLTVVLLTRPEVREWFARHDPMQS